MAVGSITKTFVAAEVMRLAGQGLVDLDAAVSDYVAVPFDTRGATVRQVLGMRSGFPQDPIDTMFQTAAQDLDRRWTTAESIAMADADGPRQGSLGAFDYNNLNFLVAGRLVEQATGKPLATALTRDLIQPAGLERVWVQDAQQPEAPLTVSQQDPAQDTVDDDGPWLPSRSVASAVGPAGGIAADAPSLAHWGHQLYGGLIIDTALVEQMTACEDGCAFEWYGLGSEGWVRDGQTFLGHGGNIGTYHGNLVYATDDNVSIAVLVPAPIRNASEADIQTQDVPYLLLSALKQQ
jgi:D-alanyl-D-alanine carboxypeptidase